MVHYSFGKKIVFLLSFLFVATLTSYAVPVHINSGNPAYPFPQFLEYAYGNSHRLGNLGTRNAEGVVHAEMEQEIRDAYQVHANEFEYAGDSALQGIRYIKTPYKAAYDCTEGDGYALLAAAYMGDAVTFNGYWLCTHDKRRSRTKRYIDCSDNADSYLYGPYALSDHGTGGNTAADGDVDVALALYVAYKQWGEFMKDAKGDVVVDKCGNPISYKEAMIEVIRGLVALSTARYSDVENGSDNLRVNSGMIGLDGYPKGGDTWNEQTGFVTASNNPLVFPESREIWDLRVGGDLKPVDVKGLKLYPEYGGAHTQHVDYNAPSYFKEFYDLLKELGGDPWEIEQFRRGEASSDWLIEDLLGKGDFSVPTAGWVSVYAPGDRVDYWKYFINVKDPINEPEGTLDSTHIQFDATTSGTEFSNFNQGEDYRCSWRTICNYMWHGNPSYRWNPDTHQVEEGTSTAEYDAAVRFSKWMNDPSSWNPAQGSHCIEYGSIHNMPYGGPATIRWQNDPITGVPLGSSPGSTAFTGQDFYCSLSMQAGTGSYAAVGAEDYELMGLLYRECAIKWDTRGAVSDISYPESEKNNVGMRSNYMHGWARQMGMMVLSGNYPAPSQMKPTPNMKIYRAIKDSVTFCFTGDSITYLLDYRNYGSVDAENVVIVENVPKDFEVILPIPNGGKYDESNRTITWTIGDVKGYHSDGTESGYQLDLSKANLKATMGQVSYTIKVGDNASGRYCTTAEITCSNGSGWVSNEYPNYKTATMQRNCVDVLKRSLQIEKKVNREKVNPGQTAIYSIDFENSSEVGWIDGGRPRVTASWALNPNGGANDNKAKEFSVRLFHDAIEPIINYSNYRVSYYAYDPTVNALCDNSNEDKTDWSCGNDKTKWSLNFSPGFFKKVIPSHEIMVEDYDKVTGKKWNQRVMLQFPCVYSTTSTYVSWNTGGANSAIHKGDVNPMQIVGIVTAGNSDKTDWSDDWSSGDYVDKSEAALYYPISPARQRMNSDGQAIVEPINKWVTCGCTESPKIVENILVEEFDGYVWRRILGDGPVAGRDIDSVYIRDTLPVGLQFAGFVGDCPLEEFGASVKQYKTSSDLEVVEWFIPKMQAGLKGTLSYKVVASFPSGKSCETDDEIVVNRAWISGVNNSPISDSSMITITCGKAPDPISQTTMTKSADKESYEEGDEISYTIGYKQTHGAVFEDAGQDASQWSLTTSSDGQWSTGISDGKVTLASGSSAEYKNSMSQNIFLSMECDADMDDQETRSKWYLQLRENVRIYFTHRYVDDGQITFSFKVGDDERESITYALTRDNKHIKIAVDLTDDVLRFWFNKDTSKLAITLTDIPVSKGRVKIVSPNTGTVACSNIHIHTDYAYDLSIVDLVPAEVEVDESSFESYHNGALAGTGKLYKGAEQDSIVWTGLAENPIAFGDTFTVKWKGKVVKCVDMIYNLAKTKLLGHANNEIQADEKSGCGEDEKCPLEGVELLLEKDTICSGASIKMQALPKGNFKYCYTAVFGESEVLRDTVETNTYEYTPTSAGDYKFKVEIVSKKIQCTTPSDVVELNVVASPVGAHTEIEIPFCPGAIDQELSVLKKNIALYEREKYTIDWFDADGESIAQPEFSELKEVGKYQYSYLLTTKEGCKAKEKANVSFELEQIADPVVKTPITYLLKDTTANGTFANLLMHDADVVDSPKDLVWYDENMQIVQGTPIPPVPANGTDTICTYYVKRQNNRGCESDLVELKVIVSGMAVPLVHDIIYCLNEEATPLWVEPGTVENSDKEWEVVYYSADGIELTVDELRTPKTNVAGTTTYYVAQREVGNPSNISSKVPLTVTVVGVPLPDVSMNQTEYCKGEQYKDLLVQSKFDQLSNTTSYFRWSIDGRSVEGTPVAEKQVETIIYGVVDSVRIDNDHYCLSDTAKLEVTTMFIPAPAGTHNVTYLKEEADEDGFYKPLLEKNPQAVTLKDMNAGYSFVWYDSLMQLIDVSDLRPDEYGSPSPQKESSWDDQKVVGMKYHVRQKLGRCLSDTVHVDVLISDDLMPDVYPMNYCHHADAEPLTASINSGDESSTGYELLWYSPADDYTTPSTEAPTPSTEEVGMTIYKVSQIKDGKESPTVPLRVTIFPNPELIVKELPQTCGEEIHIKQYVELNNTIDTSNVSFHSYNDPNCQNQMDDKDTVFTKSGTFYAKAYYTIFSEPNIVGVCSSTIEKIDVSIDDLSDFVATAPNSVCPNGEIELSATAKSTTREDIQFVWSGDAEGEGETLTTQDETGEFGKTYTYKVEASAGACHYDTTLTVKVGQGELTGVMKVNDKETKNFATCGGESITLSTTHEGSDYKWSDLEGNALGTGKSLTVTPDEAKASLSYIVSLVNKCETSDTIVVDVHPLRLTADFSKLDVPICEKSEASASLTLQGYDPDMENAYIKWFHGTEELTAWAGQTTLTLSSVTTDDSGDYTYEVSNGICLAKTDDAKLKATLKVKPYVKFEEPTTFEAPYGDPAELSISGVVPSSASAAWKGTSHEGEGLPFSVTSVTADELFKVTLSADNYCDVEANVQLLVDAKVAVKITAEKDMICLDDQAVLTADTSDTKGKVLHPESYQIEWYAVDAESGVEQKLNGSGFSLNDTPASSLSYYSKVIYGTQEVKSEAVAVEVVAPVQYTLPENLVSCSGENVDIEVTVTAGDDPKIVWTEDQSTEFTLTVAPEESHTYEFTLTNKDMCPVVGSAFVDVKDAPIITMDDSRKVCEGADVVVSPKVEGEDVVAYEWRDAEDELIFRELKLEFTPEESGYIYFIAKSGSCGSSKDSIYVEVVELPVVTVDSLSFTQREIQVENDNGGAYMYRVDKLDWQEDNLYVGLGYGMMHTAYVKDEFGCIGLTPFFVVKPPVQINEFFTPDEDGVHDVWEVTTIMEAYPNSTVKIYDRWGKVVGTLDSSNQEWDGTYNGRPLPSTDYWYLITVPEIRRQFKGHFTLIRN